MSRKALITGNKEDGFYVIDANTGEIISRSAEEPRTVLVRKTTQLARKFVLCKQDGFKYLSECKLPSAAFRTLAYILSKVDFQGTLSCNSGELAHGTNTTRKTASISLQHLCDARLIERERVHRGFMLVLNPAFFWRGSLEAYRAANNPTTPGNVGDSEGYQRNFPQRTPQQGI